MNKATHIHTLALIRHREAARRMIGRSNYPACWHLRSLAFVDFNKVSPALVRRIRQMEDALGRPHRQFRK